jgi:replicative DNA helicase
MYNRNSERAVLSSCINTPYNILDIRHKINDSSYFFIEEHKHLYDIILELYDAHEENIDYNMIQQRIYDRDLLSIIPKKKLESIIKVKTTDNSLAKHVKLLVDKKIDRVVYDEICVQKEKLENGSSDARDVLEIFEGMEDMSDDDKEISAQYICDIDISTEPPEDIKTNLYKPRAFRMGKGKVTVVAARPGMGKTRFAIQNAWESANYFNDHVYFASAEMSKSDVSLIMASCEYDKNIIDMYDKAEKNKYVSKFKKKTKGAGNLIIDEDCMSIEKLISSVKRAHKKRTVDTLVIDYIQLISAKGFSPSDNYGRSTYVSRMITVITKKLNLRTLLLSQLNRGVEFRDNKRPMLSDLRETGQIEQDAALILFLYRAEYYGIKEYDDNEKLKVGIAEVICAKNRFGRTGTYELHFGCGIVSVTENIDDENKYAMFRNKEDVEVVNKEEVVKKDNSIDVMKAFK